MATINAMEGQDVAVMDIPDIFLSTGLGELVHMSMQGKLAKLMVKVVHELYCPFLSMKNGNTLLHVRL